MRFKLRHVVVLFMALFLGAVAMYIGLVPWLRVLVAAALLFPIIYAADGLGIGRMLNVQPVHTDPTVRHRRFGPLRSEVKQLLDVVRRLNWLTVDLERSIRNEDDVKAEIAQAERRLEEILDEIRSAAGRPTADAELDAEWEGHGGSEDEVAEEREGHGGSEDEVAEEREGAHESPREQP